MESHPSLSPLQHIRAYLGERPNAKLASKTNNPLDVDTFLEPDSPFYQLGPDHQQLLARFVTNIVKQIDGKSEDKVFSGVTELASALDDASNDALKLVRQGWAGKTAVQLCLRHDASVLENLVEEFLVHPMLSAPTC